MPIILIWLAMWGVFSIAHAEEKSPAVAGDDMTLQALIKAAVLTHPSIQVSLHAVSIAKDQEKATSWQSYPSLTIQADHRASGTGNYPYTGSQVPMTGKVEMPVWTWGKLDNDKKTASVKVQNAELGLEEAKQQITLKTLEQWKLILTNFSDRQELQSLIQFGKLQREQIEKRIDVGAASKLDLMQIDLKINQAEIKIDSLNKANEQVLKNLSQITGKKIEANSVERLYQEVLAKHIDAEKINATNQKEIERKILEKNYSIKKSKMDYELAELELSTASARKYPDVIGRYQYQAGGQGFGSTEGIYFSTSFQPGNGFGLLSNISAAKSRLSQSLSQQQAAESDQALLAEMEVQEYIDNCKMLEQIRKNQHMYQGIYESTERLHVAGRKTTAELINAKQEQISMETQINKAKIEKAYGYAKILVRLDELINY